MKIQITEKYIQNIKEKLEELLEEAGDENYNRILKEKINWLIGYVSILEHDEE